MWQAFLFKGWIIFRWRWTPSCLSIQLSMTLGFCPLGPSEVRNWGSWDMVHKYHLESLIPDLLSMCLEEGFLSHGVLFLFFEGLPYCLHNHHCACISTNSAQGFQLLHITNTCYFLFIAAIWGGISLCFDLHLPNDRSCLSFFLCLLTTLCILWRNIY